MNKKLSFGFEAYIAPDCSALCTLPGGVLCQSPTDKGSGSIQDWEDGVTFTF